MRPPQPPSPSRRRYLRTGAALAAGLFAGCAVDDGSTVGGPGSAGEPGTPAPTDTVTSTATPDATGTPDATPTEIHAGYDTTEVRARTPGGELLGSVTAAIADTPELRYLGLSDTGHLPEDRGMLFVYDEVVDRTFVMREMEFGIDIVYADGEGVITAIHHAPKPDSDETGAEQTYPGRGQYVLEVNYEWTSERGVTEGDVLTFEL